MKKINRGNLDSNLYFLEKVGALSPESKILEIGSGNGVLLNALQKKGFANLTGTEINDEYINYSSENYGINLVKMDGEALSFDNETFDFVLSFDVFEHIPNTVKHIQEVSRVLKKEGAYLFGTPNKWTNIPFEILKEKSFVKYREYHCSLHNYWQIIQRFSNLGFRVEFIDVPVVNDFFRAKMEKYLGGIGTGLLNILNPDKFPIFLRTNFYVIAFKDEN